MLLTSCESSLPLQFPTNAGETRPFPLTAAGNVRSETGGASPFDVFTRNIGILQVWASAVLVEAHVRVWRVIVFLNHARGRTATFNLPLTLTLTISLTLG